MLITVLGAGLVGGPMALDLANDGYQILLADKDESRLMRYSGVYNIKTVLCDLSSEAAVQSVIKDADFVLSAVPGFMGFQTLKTIISAGKNVVDIAFFPENLFELDELAREKGVIAISDMGVAPGMSNLLTGYVDTLLDETHKVVIYVGGLPKVRTWPFEYKAVFSPVDVIEEYTRPARYVEHGELVVKPPLTDPELLTFNEVGTLEAFNSDGLRSLIDTVKAPFMIEKTLRYPGHIDKIKVMKEAGFFSETPVNFNGTDIRPLDFTTKILLPNWKLEKGEEDFTIMRIIVEGVKDHQKLHYQYDLYDEFDRKTGVHSMARTTGYVATMALRLLINNLYKRKGVSAPEQVGQCTGCMSFMLKGLRERGVNYRETITII